MIRAVFFDFYSVWVPDVFTDYLAEARQQNPAIAGELQAVVDKYFFGEANSAEVAEAFRSKLARPDIDANQFTLQETDISPAVIDLMHELHGRFVKLGVLANLGTREYEILTRFNAQNQVFEIIAGPLALRIRAPLLSQDVFTTALRAIGEPPASCLVVSGNQNYLQFAQSIGVRALPFAGLPNLRQTLDQLLASETA